MNTDTLTGADAVPGRSEPTKCRVAPRLLTRTLGVTFVTVALILAAVFLTLTLDLRRRARSHVADALEDGRVTMVLVDERRLSEFASLSAALTANPTFVSGLQKYRNEMGSFSRAEVQLSLGWMEGRLLEMAEVLRADVVLLRDSRGRTMAKAGPLASEWPGQLGAPSGLADEPETLAQWEGHSWRVVRLPLRVHEVEVANLCIADRLDQRYAISLSTLTRSAIAVISERQIAATTLDEPEAGALVAAVTGRVPGESGEIDARGDRYAYRRLLGGDRIAVYALATLGTEMSKSTASAYRALAVVAAGSLLLAWLGSFVLARRLSAPIDRISQSLAAAVDSKTLRVQLPQDGSSREVDAMTVAFNHLMASLEHAEKETQAAYVGAIRALATALDARDSYTAGHSERVSMLSVQIAERMQLPSRAIEVVRLGALLHDIGKIGVHDAVLNKAGRLSTAERAVIQAHPVLGARILEPVAFLAPHLPIVELHHECPDGSGYPYGLTGEEIPLEARIVRIADAYDAMTSSRPYRPARTPDEALDELLELRGTQFDAAVVDVLVALVRHTPPALVERDGESRIDQVA